MFSRDNIEDVFVSSFMAGDILPLFAVFRLPIELLNTFVSGASLIYLALLGGLAARSGAGILKGAARVTFWGALAMVLTAGIGALVGRAI